MKTGSATWDRDHSNKSYVASQIICAEMLTSSSSKLFLSERAAHLAEASCTWCPRLEIRVSMRSDACVPRQHLLGKPPRRDSEISGKGNNGWSLGKTDVDPYQNNNAVHSGHYCSSSPIHCQRQISWLKSALLLRDYGRIRVTVAIAGLSHWGPQGPMFVAL